MEGASTPVSLPMMTPPAPPQARGVQAGTQVGSQAETSIVRQPQAMDAPVAQSLESFETPAQDLPASGEGREAEPFADLLASAVLAVDHAGAVTGSTIAPATVSTAVSTSPDAPFPMLQASTVGALLSQEGQAGTSIFSDPALVGMKMEIGTSALFASEAGAGETATPTLPASAPASFSPFVGAPTAGVQVAGIPIATDQAAAKSRLDVGSSGLLPALSREMVQQQLRPVSEPAATTTDIQLSPDSSSAPVLPKPAFLLNAETMPAEQLVESRPIANIQTARVETLASTPMTALQTSAPATVESTSSGERGSFLSFHDQLSSQSLKGEQMGERLLVMLNKEQRQATLRMDPPELGQLKVSLRVDGDQVSVQFQAANGQLRDMLNQQVDRLRQFFDQQQMNLVDVSVSHDRSQEQQMEQGASSGDDQEEQRETVSLSVSGESGAYSFKPQGQAVGFLDIYA